MLSLKKRSLALTAGAAIAMLALSGCGASGGDSAAPATDPNASAEEARAALLEQAREEGELNLVWGEVVLGGSAGTAKLAEGFREYYDLPDFKINFTPGPSMPQMAATTVQEAQAGVDATSDIFLAYSGPFAGTLEQDFDVVSALDWSWAENVPADSVSGAGAGVAVQTSFPVITYNSDVVKTPPSSLDDLLESKWEGRIASTPYASGFYYLETGEDEIFSFLEEFTAQIGGLMRCTEHDRLLSGEFDILAFDCDQMAALQNEREGGPLRYVISEDLATEVHAYAGVPVNSAHPAAAQLFINYLMTRDAQDIIWDLTGGDSTYVEGSQSGQTVADFEAEGLEFTAWTLEDVLNPKRYPNPDAIAKMGAILTGTQ